MEDVVCESEHCPAMHPVFKLRYRFGIFLVGWNLQRGGDPLLQISGYSHSFSV